ncbi:hypothetical protein BsWGS_04056 [Bradybaena similaris]
METVCGLRVTEVTKALASDTSHQLLIIDCRSFMAFNQGHILESVNIHCPPILKRRSGGFIALEHIVPCEGKRSQLLRGLFSNVVVYDENTQELGQVAGDSNLLSVIQSLLKQVDRLTVRFIIGGFEAVREECPVLCMNQKVQISHCVRDKLTQKNKDSAIQTVPAEILPHLYLGDIWHSSQRQLLQHLGITAMLNVSSSCENFFQSHFRYMNIQVNDTMDADLLSWFPKIIEFIDSVAQQQGKVLVHCRAGVSRSATVCIAYLMQKQQMSLDAAFEFVVSRRPIIDPNLNFIQQLQRFEASLRPQQQTNFLLPTFMGQPQAKSAPPLSTTSFTFFQEKPNSNLHQDMDTSSSLSIPPSQQHHVSSNAQSPLPASNKINVSNDRLSQTSAAPHPSSPVTSPPSRPFSLPLVHVSTPLSPHLPNIEIKSGSYLSPSSHQPPSLQVSPFRSIFHESTANSQSYRDSYVSAPRTPIANHQFTFLSSDIVTCQALSISSDITSPRQCRPTTPSVLDTSSTTFLGSKHTFPAVTVPHSPLSPLAVPLSPLPSFG